MSTGGDNLMSRINDVTIICFRNVDHWKAYYESDPNINTVSLFSRKDAILKLLEFEMRLTVLMFGSDS